MCQSWRLEDDKQICIAQLIKGRVNFAKNVEAVVMTGPLICDRKIFWFVSNAKEWAKHEAERLQIPLPASLIERNWSVDPPKDPLGQLQA